VRKIYCPIILVFASLTRLYSQTDCKLKKDQDSIKVYTCHTDTSRFKSIVAEFTINTTPEELMQTVMDIPGYTQWQYNTVEAKVLRKISASEQIYRTVIEAPWPVTDRDMVVRIKVKYEDNNKIIITTESETGILPEKEGYVRVPSSRGKWVVTQATKNRLQVKFTIQIDPGGSVPVWLVNWVCAQAPYQSFKNLKTILEKKK
jgi:START domain